MKLQHLAAKIKSELPVNDNGEKAVIQLNNRRKVNEYFAQMSKEDRLNRLQEIVDRVIKVRAELATLYQKIQDSELYLTAFRSGWLYTFLPNDLLHCLLSSEFNSQHSLATTLKHYAQTQEIRLSTYLETIKALSRTLGDNFALNHLAAEILGGEREGVGKN